MSGYSLDKSLHPGDDESDMTCGSVHTFASSGAESLRKLTPQMKNPSMKKKTKRNSESDPTRLTKKNLDQCCKKDDDDDMSDFSSVHTFSTFGPNSHNNAKESGVKDTVPMTSKSGMRYMIKKYLSSLNGGVSIERLYTIKSPHTNPGLHVRCGFAQRKNNREKMEDCITVCPSFMSVCKDAGTVPVKNSENEYPSEADFSFFGVYDGHDGDYVSNYLKEHLMSYFQESLWSKMSTLTVDQDDNTENIKDRNGDTGIWRTSLLEAARRVDREILKLDAKRLREMSEKRRVALDDNSVDGKEGKVDETLRESFAGSTAAVVIVYRAPTQLKDKQPVEESTPSKSEFKGVLPPLLSTDEDDCDIEEDAGSFHEDVVVGLMTKGSYHVDADQYDVEGKDMPFPLTPSGNGFRLKENGKGPIQSLQMRNRMKRFSSTESAYEAHAEVLNLDDENHVLEALVYGQSLRGKTNSRQSFNSSKLDVANRASTYSILSDITMSFGNMSVFGLNSSDDLLHRDQRSSSFNPKRQNLAAAVRRKYEESSTEDFSIYDASQMEELVDEFLTRAELLDKAAADCRGQAAELLQVLQQKVRSVSNSERGSLTNSSQYVSSLDASPSVPSTRSRSLNSDSVSELSPNTSINSSRTVSSLGSISSLRSFDDVPLVTQKRQNMTKLDTVAESLFESRGTSFAGRSSASFGSTSAFTDYLVGEAATKDIKLLIAHAGDCRVVLSDAGQPVQVTIDHTPLVEEEKYRIKESGGFVSNKRVNGVLAVSRSFGDIKFKSFNDSLSIPDSVLDEGTAPEGIWNNRNQVISMPDILELDVQSSYEFLVIASDCVWETLTCAEVINFVRTQIFDHGDAMIAAESLAAKVHDDGGTDNCSVIIVNLNQN